MTKSIAIFLSAILTSFYFFPFEFKGLPGINTKMMMALVGLVICGLEISKNRSGQVSKNLFTLTAFALVVSLCGFISVTINGTPDYAYATYVMSMWVWVGGAYAVCYIIRHLHGKLDIRLLCNYLTAVCVTQCTMALLIDHSPAVQQFVDSIVEQGQDFLNQSTVNRMYGIGANLDVAGSRFAAVMVILAAVIAEDFRKGKQSITTALYIVSFIIISIVGNMIARTTLTGLVVVAIYWIYDSGIWRLHLNKGYYVLLSWMTIATVVAVIILTFLYNTDMEMRKSIRFGFEGFFSLYEKGTWDVSSNNRLATMYVFPESMKTWIIGDGYFSNPRNIDPYFIGKETGGFYMGTDVGYLRFIFYFGLTGLAVFTAFFIKACSLCISRFAEYKLLFLMLLTLNFIIWFKVATDLFLVFALFVMMSEGNNEEEQPLEQMS